MQRKLALFVLFGLIVHAPASAQISSSSASVRFFGTGVGPPGQQDRVRIPIDDDAPGPDASAPCDLGAASFTIDFWIRGTLAANATANAGGDREFFDFRWIEGNIIIDRDVFGGTSRDWGISIAGGFVRFGTGTADNAPLDTEHTIEGDENVLTNTWRHIAVVRDASSGVKSIYIDGALDYASPPNRSRDDITYPDDGAPGQQTPWGPYIVIAAEKHDAGEAYPSFTGFVDEVRFWNRALAPSEVASLRGRVLRRGSSASVGLVGCYRFEEGSGTMTLDSSAAGSPPGELIAGTPGNGEWALASADPLNVAPVFLCPGDADGDFLVRFADVTTVLAQFGSSTLDGFGQGDADADGDVDFADITSVLANFAGFCP